MSENEIRNILTSYKTVAVVGMSGKPDRPSQQVPLYLKAHGYNIIPVNPNATEIAGMKVYPNMTAIPEKVDVVEIFMRSEDVPAVVQDAIKIGAKVVWMQEGIENEQAAAQARAAGLAVVQNMCMRAMHRYLFGIDR